MGAKAPLAVPLQGAKDNEKKEEKERGTAWKIREKLWGELGKIKRRSGRKSSPDWAWRNEENRGKSGGQNGKDLCKKQERKKGKKARKRRVKQRVKFRQKRGEKGRVKGRAEGGEK